MKRLLPLFALPALLAACDERVDTSIEDSPSIVTENETRPEDQAPVFRAVGQEPGWIVRIFPDITRYEADYGERIITVATPEAEEIDGGRRYATDALTIEVLDTPCNDAMSGAPYPATVSVDERNRPTVRGCGGPGDYQAPPPE